ncbi:MAG: DUF3090 domain-containing protein [Anaerolineae bacterium]|nr:MAG: DUF3090 domain-containing protein [Anaerolineae bacterium]
MAHLVCDFNPVDRITVGAIGPPGQRVFTLQASQGTRVVTLVFEKEQARALASGVLRLLDQLESDHAEDQRQVEAILVTQMHLHPPAEPEFRIGQMGIGFDEESDSIVILAYELADEEGQDIGVARFWTTREQARALAQHALEVVEAGRPSCPLCGEPMDPEGHFCPRGNGHGKVTEIADLDFSE